ncbi:MAG: SDR family NAD(P)-dependent oxidoreductase [Chitinophagaceae bacterium]
MKTIAVITGATSGLGKATAYKLASLGYQLIITGRREERLKELVVEITADYKVNVLPLCFDVQSKQQTFAAFENLPTQWQNIGLLVNNAGLALGRDSFENAEITDWETMIDTNVKGLMYVTKAILPYMIAAKKGHIINIGSIAGKEVYQNGNGYCASKFAVDALSKSMRIDLLPHKIKVTGIHPGAVDTEFSLVRFKGDANKAAAVYNGYEALTANDVADVIAYCASLPPHVCINDLVLTPLAQANSFYLWKE